jgi:hypothetical protein
MFRRRKMTGAFLGASRSAAEEEEKQKKAVKTLEL